MEKLEKQLLKALKRLNKLKEQAESLKDNNFMISRKEALHLCEIDMPRLQTTHRHMLHPLYSSSPNDTIEVGKWYKVKSVDALFFLEEIIEDNKCKGYGFLDGEWYDNRKSVMYMGFATETHNYIEASREEVREALIKEAKRRYKVGDKLSKVYVDRSRGKRVFSHDLEVYLDGKDVYMWICDDVSDCGTIYHSCIFYNGTWADVVVPAKEPKISDICKFWNANKKLFTIGKLENICGGLYFKYLNINNGKYYMNCEPLDPNMTLGEVFGKEENNE